jgi:hypothetical protein
MNNKIKSIILVMGISGFIFTACASYTPITPTQVDVDQASKLFPGTTMADLMQGKTIFEQNCGKCHSRNKPFTKTQDQIRNVLPKMASRAKIDNSSQELILKYLLTMTSKKSS